MKAKTPEALIPKAQICKDQIPDDQVYKVKRGSLPLEPVLSAPGKVVLFGEYAVLHGGVAWVAAVDKRATMDVAGNMDTTAFFFEGRKLGLGSSAATCVLQSAHVAMMQYGETSIGDKTALFEQAYARHRQKHSPEGSGMDVFASTWGGVHQVCFAGKQARALQLQHHWTWIVSDTASSTRLQLERMSKGTQTSHALTRLGTWTQTHRNDLQEHFVPLVNDFTQQMDAIARQSGILWIETSMRNVQKRVQDMGGAYKPSGAGAGDLSFAVFEDEGAKLEFDVWAKRHGMTLIDLNIHDNPGVQCERGQQKGVSCSG